MSYTDGGPSLGTAPCFGPGCRFVKQGYAYNPQVMNFDSLIKCRRKARVTLCPNLSICDRLCVGFGLRFFQRGCNLLYSMQFRNITAHALFVSDEKQETDAKKSKKLMQIK